jgi:phage-related protein
VALAPGIAQLAGQIAGVMVPAIQTLNPLLVALAGFLSENMSWIGPLAGVVVGLAAAFKAYSAAATAVAAVQTVLNSAMLASVVGWLRNTAAIVANRIALVAGAVAMGVVRAATIAWTAVQWLLNVALSANPIGLVVLAIAALVAGIIYAYKNSETFRNIVQATWAAIKVAISAVVNWITGTVWPSLQEAWQQLASGAKTLWGWIKTAWNGIKTAISVAINAVKTVVKAVWSGIVAFVRAYIKTYKAIIMAGFNAAKTVITTVMNAARNVVRAVWNAIVSYIRAQINAVKSIINGVKSVVNTIRNAFQSAKNAAQSQINAMVNLVRSLPRRISGALGNLGRLLYSKGQALIRGFINGIKSMLGAVGGAAKSIVNKVTSFLPGSPAKEGPLSGRGYVLLRARRFMDDFAKGMDDGAKKPAAALMGAVNPVARAVVPAASRTVSGASTAHAQTSGALAQRVYRVAIGDRTFADLVVDAVTGAPVAVSKASKEGSRRSAWAGSGR